MSRPMIWFGRCYLPLDCPKTMSRATIVTVLVWELSTLVIYSHCNFWFVMLMFNKKKVAQKMVKHTIFSIGNMRFNHTLLIASLGLGHQPGSTSSVKIVLTQLFMMNMHKSGNTQQKYY